MTTGRTTGRTWRRLASLTALTLITVTTIGFNAPARASEFNPKPTGSVTASCDGGPHFHVTLGNVEGNAAADMHITVMDDAPASLPDLTVEQLVAGDSTVVDLPETEDHGYHIGVYADGNTTTTLDEMDHTFNCEGPSATVEIACGIQGVDVTYRLTNPDPVAHDFDVLEPDGSTWVVPVPAQMIQYQAGIDGNDILTPFDATASVDGKVLVTQHYVPDCFAPKAVVTFDCTDQGPQVTFDLSNEGKSRALMRWAIDSNITSIDVLAEILAGAPTFEAKVPLAEGQNYTATVVDQFSGQTMVTLSGTATCAPPETTPPTTEPPTTEPPTTDPSTTVAPTTSVPETSTTAPPATVSAVTAEPSFTG